MKKIVMAFMASASLFAAQTANATTYTPAGTWTFSGTVQVQKGSGPVLNCAATVVVTVPNAAPDAHGSASHGHSATANVSLAMGDLGCITVGITSNPHTVSATGSGTGAQVTIANVYADTTITPGDCAGNLTATFANGTPDTLTVATTLPAVTPGTGDCTIDGVLDLTSPSDVNITNP